MTELFDVNVERHIDAPIETVFAFFTDPDRYRSWMGVGADLDPQPGGKYRVQMTGRSELVAVGVYLAIEPPRRISFTWGWEPGGRPPEEAIDVPVGTSKVDVTLEPDGDGTLVRLRHTGLPTRRTHRFHDWGWGLTLDRLSNAVIGAPDDNPFLSM